MVLKTVVPLRAPWVRQICNMQIWTTSFASSPKGAQLQLRIHPAPSARTPLKYLGESRICALRSSLSLRHFQLFLLKKTVVLVRVLCGCRSSKIPGFPFFRYEGLTIGHESRIFLKTELHTSTEIQASYFKFYVIVRHLACRPCDEKPSANIVG